jgi:hypothetical protein
MNQVRECGTECLCSEDRTIRIHHIKKEMAIVALMLHIAVSTSCMNMQLCSDDSIIYFEGDTQKLKNEVSFNVTISYTMYLEKWRTKIRMSCGILIRTKIVGLLVGCFVRVTRTLWVSACVLFMTAVRFVTEQATPTAPRTATLLSNLHKIGVQRYVLVEG